MISPVLFWLMYTWAGITITAAIPRIKTVPHWTVPFIVIAIWPALPLLYMFYWLKEGE